MQQTDIALNVNASEMEAPDSLLKLERVAISIVVPIMNEQESIQILFDRITEQLNQLEKTFEIIFIVVRGPS